LHSLGETTLFFFQAQEALPGLLSAISFSAAS
jgi:hypothetical protein